MRETLDLAHWQALLGSASPLASLLPAFRPRAQQQEMAARVAQLLASGGIGLMEAGTGTGKSFAYLLPALQAGRQVLVSTGSRALQDQLLDKDLPLLQRAWPQGTRAVRLKGRGNYLCRYRLQESLQMGVSTVLQRDLLRVAHWAAATSDGDVAELHGVAEESLVWPLVTSTRENCLGSDCPEQGQCHVLEARRRAQEAELVVINHHLLLSDLALKNDGKGDLLPNCPSLLIDEAHQLPELTAQFFGEHLSAHRLAEWARDSRMAALEEAGDDASVPVHAQAVEQAVAQWQESLEQPNARQEWRPQSAEPVVRYFHALRDKVIGLSMALRQQAERGKLLEQCSRRGQELQSMMDAFASAEKGGEEVRWVERRGRGMLLHATPLDPAKTLQQTLFSQYSTVLLTSATLRIGGDFVGTRQLFGIDSAVEFVAETPFDYAHQALLYLPSSLPNPNDPRYTRSCLEMALPVIEASKGRTFFLFTSHRALQEAAAFLAERLPYLLLVQGQAPRARLLEQFRSSGNAVLLGAASFWEGIDVQGEALSTVIIDKIPFANPNDPVLQARVTQMRAQGRDPFTELQIPQAVIALCQGVGRLIRAESDRGVLMLCDPRLQEKGYGKIFLRSLPPMRRSSLLADVRQFWQEQMQ